MIEHTQTREPRRATRGFFPVVAGNDVQVERGGGLMFLARRHLSIEQGGGQWLVSGGTLDVRQGGGAALIAKEALVSKGNVGVLIAGRATIAPGSRVLLRATPTVALAAVASFAAGWLFGHRGRSR
ncbi:MAG TPA: hypothetical protein VKB50_15805 [Vicinamibacterales bacterium]|nr:hypothetical protein [Vicinamibacterales bacterium]